MPEDGGRQPRMRRTRPMRRRNRSGARARRTILRIRPYGLPSPPRRHPHGVLPPPRRRLRHLGRVRRRPRRRVRARAVRRGGLQRTDPRGAALPRLLRSLPLLRRPPDPPPGVVPLPPHPAGGRRIPPAPHLRLPEALRTPAVRSHPRRLGERLLRGVHTPPVPVLAPATPVEQPQALLLGLPLRRRRPPRPRSHWS